jgi:hypothetical protein
MSQTRTIPLAEPCHECGAMEAQVVEGDLDVKIICSGDGCENKGVASYER